MSETVDFTKRSPEGPLTIDEDILGARIDANQDNVVVPAESRFDGHVPIVVELPDGELAAAQEDFTGYREFVDHRQYFRSELERGLVLGAFKAVAKAERGKLMMDAYRHHFDGTDISEARIRNVEAYIDWYNRGGSLRQVAAEHGARGVDVQHVSESMAYYVRNLLKDPAKPVPKPGPPKTKPAPAERQEAVVIPFPNSAAVPVVNPRRN